MSLLKVFLESLTLIFLLIVLTAIMNNNNNKPKFGG